MDINRTTDKINGAMRNRKQRVARVRYPPVVVCTGLPPLVDGQIRCFLKLTIRRLRFAQMDTTDTSDYIIRVKWWGEPSDGAYFKPICGRKASGRLITARYAVRCGPRQFVAYLMDAGALALELLSEGNTDKVLGVANVTEVVALSMQNPVIGWYKMLSVSNHKHVADVHVNMSLSALQDIYGESSGTGTGTERSQDESDDSATPADIGRTYRVERNFVENEDFAKPNAIRVPLDSNQRSVLDRQGDNENSNVTNEVDRLIERAELLKMLISPSGPENLRTRSVPPSVQYPHPTPEFDLENSELYSDAGLIADLFYTREKQRADSSVQVTPIPKSPIKSALRPPEMASPARSPAPEVRKLASPKVVKFAPHLEPRKKIVPNELISLLKRVKGAIVHVHTLRFSAGDYRHFVAGSIPRRSLPMSTSSFSKPPRPLKISFFVNAQFPTGELCQLHRMCGKTDLETNTIDFQQAEIVPLILNDSKVMLWLESAAITFRVSCRHASVNRTQPLGVAVFSLEPLLFSEDFKSRQMVALSTRSPGSMMEISVELQVASVREVAPQEITADQIEQLEERHREEETTIDQSPRRSQQDEVQQQDVVPPVQPAPPALVVFFGVSEVEFDQSFVKRVSGSDLSRWEVYLTVAAFGQPRRSSTRRHVVMKLPRVAFSPKLQLYYVYTLDPATTSRFEDNYLVAELRRHMPASEEDELLAICKVSLHQLYLAYGCDPVATSAVLRSPGAIVSVNEDFIPADDPFTLASVARLRCTLAAGSADQIAQFNALAMKRDLVAPEPPSVEPVHTPKSQETIRNRLTMLITEVDQLYIPIESDAVEADVFVSYNFPSLLGMKDGETEIRTFRTPLRSYKGQSVAVTFGNDGFVHDFASSAPLDDATLLANLVRAFQHLTSSSSSLAVDFAVSLRRYKPVVRDVVVGIASLSLTRLASLITSTKSSKQRQHVFVRLPVTPTGQHHPVGWLTIRLEFSGSIQSPAIHKWSSPKSKPSQGQLRINVRRAFNLRTAARRIGLKGSSSSVGFKTYCGLKTASASTTESECEVSERSYSPFFRTSQFEMALRTSHPEDMEIQLFARDRRQGDLLLGSALVPPSVIEVLLRFRPQAHTSCVVPLTYGDEVMTTSEDLIANCVGSVELNIQASGQSANAAVVPSWFQTEPRAKISLYVDKIVLAIPVGSFLSSDDAFKCRLSIGDTYSPPLSVSTARPQSSVFNGEDVVVVTTRPDSIVLEHAVPCPPYGEIIEFLTRCSAKIEVVSNGGSHSVSIPLVSLLARQKIVGQHPLTNPEVPDYYGSSIFYRLVVEPLSSSSSALRDKLMGSKQLGAMPPKGDETDTFVASVGVSRALHLQTHLLDREIYVVVGAVEPLRTHNVPSGERPVWNFAADALISRDLIHSGGLIFRLMSTSSSNNDEDPIVGYASVDVTSLSLGIGQVSGWYHLVDAFGHCLGQILVSVQPLEDIYQPARPASRTPAPIPNLLKDVFQDQEPVPRTTNVHTSGPDFSSNPVRTTSNQTPQVADGIDLPQLESLSRRIAQLLAQPLPPRFGGSTAEQGTVTTPRERVTVVETATQPEQVTEYPHQTSVPQQVERVEKATQLSISSSSSDSSKSSSSTSSKSSRIPVEGSRSKDAESPDPVQMMFEVDQMLSKVGDTSPAASPQINFVQTTVDEILFPVPQCHAPNIGRNNLGGLVGVNASADFESEDERCHLIVSPSVMDRNAADRPVEPVEEDEDNSGDSSPPPLEAPSQASTEEWSHNSAIDLAESQPDRTADDFFDFAPINLTLNGNGVDQGLTDWSAALPPQFNSPHHSSSPMSTAKGSAKFADLPSEESPASPPNTPRAGDNHHVPCNGESRNGHAELPKEKRAPPAWLNDANSKLSKALPSFFPRPDALKAALERVRAQRTTTSDDEYEVDLGEISQLMAARRPPPVFDVDEARRIARIFSGK